MYLLIGRSNNARCRVALIVNQIETESYVDYEYMLNGGSIKGENRRGNSVVIRLVEQPRNVVTKGDEKWQWSNDVVPEVVLIKRIQNEDSRIDPRTKSQEEDSM